MSYSSWHKDFATYLNLHHNINKQDVLEYPENYLGPNYKEVLNWWYHWDSWSKDQWEVWRDRLCSLDYETRDKAHQTSRELAREVIDLRFVEYLVSWEREIIAAHLYIERDIPFIYFPLIFDL